MVAGSPVSSEARSVGCSAIAATSEIQSSTRELRSSGGTELVESPVYWFRVGGPGGPAAAGALALRFAALLRALGLSELDGFTPVGATLQDGRVLPLDKLEELLAAIQAGEVAVLSAQVR